MNEIPSVILEKVNAVLDRLLSGSLQVTVINVNLPESLIESTDHSAIKPLVRQMILEALNEIAGEAAK